ncbi:copper resistance protein CopC [Paenibacillus radicis (ex Xue et al. 2023)]|uniref:Copper resistance protein CopC n=1 Tax=Paenibacillus radicis (ex Xue et al. 2023) TaxID=2972489 RepID=A0ABT1YPU5_9BACL|nr:copper resistance protein CopC [Paenibacillus radicis (ex Xue et al. 2023)]MCR8635211.1 copper resistance protein CopC [Paenibacillus radicis (ex Xue et al. 2023)]
MRNKAWIILLTLLAAVLSLQILPNAPVSAHSDMEKVYPKAAETLDQSPSTIEVWFGDLVEVYKGSIVVTSDKNVQIPVAAPRLDPKDNRHIIADIEKELPSGTYTVTVNVISIDSHPIKGTFQFVVKRTQPTEEEIFQNLKLVRTAPMDGEIVPLSPDQLELWFTESVSISAFGIFNDRGESVPTKNPVQDPANPKHYTAQLNKPLEPGTYSAHWYAGVGGHKEKNGVYYFAIQQYSSIKGTNVIPSQSIMADFGLLQVGHWLSFFGILLLAGGSFFILCIAKKLGNQERWHRFTFFLYGISVIGVSLQVASHRWEYPNVPFDEFVWLSFVWVPVLQLLAVTLGFWFLRGYLQLGMFGLAIMLWGFSGHSTSLVYGGNVEIGMDILHLLAVAVWLAGLIALPILMPKEETAATEWLGTVGRLYSKWALASIVIITLTGIWMSVSYVPSFTWESLWASNWGKMLLMKIILLIEIVIIGYLQRKLLSRIAVTSIQFLRNIRIEFFIGCMILIAVAILIDSSPREAAQGVFPDKNTVNGITATVNVTPLKSGANDIVIQFDNETELQSVKATLSMPPNERKENYAFFMGKGQYKLTGNLLHSAGTTYLDIEAVKVNGERIIIPFSIKVPGVMSE